MLFRLDPSRFDLVITDRTMPEMTGIELAKEILTLRPEMPIIMCTGFSYAVDADKAKAAGIKAFAVKCQYSLSLRNRENSTRHANARLVGV